MTAAVIRAALGIEQGGKWLADYYGSKELRAISAEIAVIVARLLSRGNP